MAQDDAGALVSLSPDAPDAPAAPAAPPLSPPAVVAIAKPVSEAASARERVAVLQKRAEGTAVGTLTRQMQLPHVPKFSSPFRLSKDMNPWWVRAGVNTAFLTLTGIVLGETIVTVDLYKQHDRLEGMETRLISNGIVTSNIFLWPILWDATIGYERMVEQPRVAFGFFWPMAISAFDMRYIFDKRAGSGHDMDVMANGLNMDAQAIISAAFAMGALMSSLKSVRGTHIIMYALIMSLALVIPQVATPSNTPDHTIILMAQKAALNNAIGFILAGIGADFLSGGANKPLFGRM